MIVFIGLGFACVRAGALIRSAITGEVMDTLYSHGKEVRLTVERLSWPRSRRFVRITGSTRFYREGDEATALGPTEIQKGTIIRAEGGLGDWGAEIVADKIVILKPQH